ncbi:hypothetical protein CTA2_3869 [Colletotrichum tanaceti]|uniref:Protein kinase domain-containing protein n=1 Tax=Colletotrichum tanaceti TaxID=1306861 RepID=A0A4U6XAQ8_9PEZI|nr:hypothetical protein CTA2_3869 [Colletotrichum tanaceti]TKW52323.1 hypothetical protein CTA1_7270 [Colletotrichum tanaceti]
MVVPTDPDLMRTLAIMGGYTIQQREVEYRKTLSSMIPDILWGAKPANISLVPSLNPTLPRRVYKLQFDAAPKPGVSRQLLIDVKFGPEPIDGSIFVNTCASMDGNLSTFDHAARIQELARSRIPQLVPRVIRVGVFDSPEGDLDYIVTEHMPDTVTLDKVWANLPPKTQSRLMDQLVAAIEILHSGLVIGRAALDAKLDAIDLSGGADYTVNPDLALPTTELDYTSASDGSFPPPHGHCPQLVMIRALLAKYANDARAARHHPPAGVFRDGADGSLSVEFTTNGVMGSVEFTAEEFHEVAHSMAVCHMDLEPRNILVKTVDLPANGPGGKTRKELKLAGIVSWQKATLAPFAMERGLKDALLGCQFNHDYAWYRLFVDRTQHLIPPSDGHAMIIIVMLATRIASRALDCPHTNMVHQEEWIRMEKLKLSFVRSGWVRKPGNENHKSGSDREYREMGNAIVRRFVAEMAKSIPAHSHNPLAGVSGHPS